MNKFVKILIFIVLFLFGVIAIGLYWTLYKPLPSHQATFPINGITDEVNVHWDPYGTPLIYASDEHDLYFTVGYVHAQERLWQMTLSQLAAEGRFAEFLGEEMIPYDIHQRTLGFWETAKRIESETSDEILEILQNYSDGVNSFIDSHPNSLPIEFSLLGLKPIHWTPTHTIAISRLMAWDQNQHWWSELSYAYLGEILDPSLFRQIIPAYSDDDPIMNGSNNLDGAAGSAIPFLEREVAIRTLLSKQGFPFGSNAWAVKGSKTATGEPLLAGDPHMGLSIPGFWFEMTLNTENHHISGATIPGSPFVILGQNKNIAWSMTNIMADDTDFFIEQESSDSLGSYVVDSLSSPVLLEEFEDRIELIKVKDGDDRLHTVRSTQNGPIISDIHPSGSALIQNKLIALRWKGHDVSHELEALYKMNRANNMTEFREAVSFFKSPGMNFIYADHEDNIAIFTGASLPIRDYNPLTFRFGWDSSYQWNGTIPFDELPHVVNPSNNYVSHANNKLHSDSYPYYISTFWEPASRIIRINEILEASDSLTVESMKMMQYDTYSHHAREITELIIPIIRGADDSEQLASAISYLENWDYQYNSTSTAASIFDLFFMNLSDNLLRSDLGDEAYETLIQLEHLPVMIVSNLLQDESLIFNVTGSMSSETQSNVILTSMLETINQLEEQFGPEPFQWRWENLNTLTLRPPLLGEAALDPEASTVLKMVVNNLLNKGPYTARGHGMSINKSQYSWHRPFDMNLGPSIRRIVDFSTPERSLSILPTGQSGHPFSPNYGDQTNLWLEGRYRTIYNDSTFFQRSSYQTMILQPN